VSESASDPTFPVPRRCPFAAPAEYGRLREAQAISKVSLRGVQETWWVSRYEEARAILTDRRFLSDRRRGDFPLVAASPTLRERFHSQPPSMNGMDGAEHIATRRRFIGEFTMRRLSTLQPRIRQIVEDRVGRLLATEGRDADLVREVSVPVPSLVICELLGVPYEDHAFFQDRIARMFRGDSEPTERQRCTNELRDYIDGLVTAKEADPGDDLISRQVERRRVEGDLDHDDLVSTVLLLMTAGHETTASMISMGVLGLLSHPEQLAVIKADPGRTPAAVEELLRYFSVAETAMLRVAAEDVAIGGVTVKADEGVLVSGLAANWDPTAFEDPQRLDVERDGRPHLAFGYGPHQCLGQHLARQELRTVFDTLFRRIPGLRLAVPVEEIEFKADDSIYGAYRLPVTW
jgi:cytochrome P450